MLRRLVPALAALALLLPLAPSSPAATAATADRAAGPRSGPLLVAGGVLTSLSGRSRLLRSTAYCPQAAFSPDGSMIATIAPDTNCWRGPIVIHRAQGRTTRLPFLPGPNGSITWSPDASEVASYVQKVDQSGIYAQGVDGSAPRLVYDPYTGPVWPSGDVSWSPDGSRIVFAGTEKGGEVDDAGRPIGAGRSYVSQLWTVPAAGGGTPELYNEPFVDPACAAGDDPCRTLAYSSPRWSPDGSKVLVHVDDITRVGHRRTAAVSSVATIAEGGAQPVIVRELARRDAAHPKAAPDYATRGLTSFWSADGRSVVSQVPVPGKRVGEPGFTRPVRIVLASGAATAVGDRYADLLGWQPCPTGTCVTWRSARRPRIGMTVRHVRPMYRLVGRVRPDQGGRVTVGFEIRRRAEPWDRVSEQLAPGRPGRFHAQFPAAPRVAKECRIVATYRVVARVVVPIRC